MNAGGWGRVGYAEVLSMLESGTLVVCIFGGEMLNTAKYVASTSQYDDQIAILFAAEEPLFTVDGEDTNALFLWESDADGAYGDVNYEEDN